MILSLYQIFQLLVAHILCACFEFYAIAETAASTKQQMLRRFMHWHDRIKYDVLPPSIRKLRKHNKWKLFKKEKYKVRLVVGFISASHRRNFWFFSGPNVAFSWGNSKNVMGNLGSSKLLSCPNIEQVTVSLHSNLIFSVNTFCHYKLAWMST